MAYDAGTVADEAALIARIKALADSVLLEDGSHAWTTYGPAGTLPANATWFVSNGSWTGCHRIVGGILPVGTRQLAVNVAADFDSFGIKNATPGGYVNNDSTNSTAAASKTQPQTPTGSWVARQNLATISFIALADGDAISALVRYTGVSAGQALGAIHIGVPIPTGGSVVQAYACAKIAAIDASVPASTVVTLDRDINAALKDQFLGDLYTQRLYFQSVATSLVECPASDFALTQRIAIKSGTLTTSGGNTQFQIDATAAGKLTGAPGGTNARYRAGRGVGDRVRLFSQPTIAYAVASEAGATPASTTALLSSDAWGGQGTALGAALGDMRSNQILNHAPRVEVNRHAAYRTYATVRDIATTMLAQADNQGRMCVGALRHLVRDSHASGITFGSFMTLDASGAQKYVSVGNAPASRGIVGYGTIGGNSPGALFLGPWR